MSDVKLVFIGGGERIRKYKELVAEPKNKRALANCILNILENFNNYEIIGKKARKLIEEKFTWLNTAKRIIEYIEKF